MQTDDWREAESRGKKAPPKAKKPLVLRESADPVKSDSTTRKGAGRPPKRVGNKPLPLRDDPYQPNALEEFFGAARNELPSAVDSGVTSSMVNAFVKDAIARNKLLERNALMRRPVDPRPDPLVLRSMENSEPAQGVIDALREDPRRILPWSHGFAAGAGAAAPHLVAATADPIGAAVGGAAFKAAGAGLRGARGVTRDFGRRLAKVPIPEGTVERVTDGARRLVLDESGQAMPGGLPYAAKAALDRADDAFEAGGQALGAAAERGLAAGTTAANTLAARAAVPGQRLGDLAHVPKVWAEDAASAIARKIDLPGRTGKNLDEWYESAKHAPAATRSPLANSILDETRRLLISDFQHTPEMHAIKEASRVAGNNVARPLEELALDLNKTRTGDELYDIHFEAAERPSPGSTARDAMMSGLRDVDIAHQQLGVTRAPDADWQAGIVPGHSEPVRRFFPPGIESDAPRLNRLRGLRDTDIAQQQLGISRAPDADWQAGIVPRNNTPRPKPPVQQPMNPQTLRDATRVRNASRDADRALEELQALPKGMTDYYDGTHLPRAYAKWWHKEGALGKFADGSLGEKWTHFKNTIADNRIEGYYKRGLEDTMDENTWLAEQASAGQTGRHWRLVKQHPDGSVTAHRDWTREERDGWGEIFNAASALQRKANKARHEAGNAYMLKEYAKPGAGDARGEFTWTPQYPGEVPPKGYTLMSTKTAGESGIPRYGALAGKYVRDDVAFTIKNVNTLKPFIDKINKVTLNNLWKKVVTIGNFPGYFVNNFFQNPLILERTGGSMFDMPAAWDNLATNSMLAQRAEEAGVIRNGVLARELGSQMKHFNATLSSPYQHTGFSIPKQIFRAMNALKKYENNGYRLAGASDDLYRMALLEGLMRRETSRLPGQAGRPMQFEEAAEIAKNAFYDSNAITAPAAQVASVIAPFAKVLWWAADNEAKAWTVNPGKAAYIDMLTAVLPIATNYALGKSWSQQRAEQEALPEYAQGHQNNFPTPLQDADGNYKYVDASAWNQRGQFFPAENTALKFTVPGTSLELPIVPRGLMPGGTVGIASQLATNTNAFTGSKLYETDHGDVIKDDRWKFIKNSVLPGITKKGLYGPMTDPLADFDSVADEFVKQMTGIKLRTADIPKAIDRNMKRTKANKASMKRNGFSQDDIDAMEEHANERLRTLNQQ